MGCYSEGQAGVMSTDLLQYQNSSYLLVEGHLGSK